MKCGELAMVDSTCSYLTTTLGKYPNSNTYFVLFPRKKIHNILQKHYTCILNRVHITILYNGMEELSCNVLILSTLNCIKIHHISSSHGWKSNDQIDDASLLCAVHWETSSASGPGAHHWELYGLQKQWLRCWWEWFHGEDGRFTRCRKKHIWFWPECRPHCTTSVTS